MIFVFQRLSGISSKKAKGGRLLAAHLFAFPDPNFRITKWRGLDPYGKRIYIAIVLRSLAGIEPSCGLDTISPESESKN
jgi:hypothetical protein